MPTESISNQSKAALLGEEQVQTRRLEGVWARIVFVVASSYTIFHLYTGGFQLLPNIIQRSIHIGFAIILCFLLYPARKKNLGEGRVPLYDIIFIILMAFASIYTTIHYDRLLTTIVGSTMVDKVVSILFLFFIVEASRRSIGPVMFIFIVIAIVYTLLGHYIPGMWGHPQFKISHLLEHLYMGTSGYFGIIVNISATLVAIFIIFATFLLTTGGGEAFMNIALLMSGRSKGGAAKCAVIASSLFGTISGSASANVVVTGSYTIPTMKRLKYKPEFAAAVEATASSGGQIMPPIMGVGAFIMAELLGVPYLKIMIAAVIPALLYFFGVWCSVHMEAQRIGLQALPADQIPSFRKIVKISYLAPVVIPLIILIYLILAGYTPMRAGFYSIVASVIIYIATSKSWPTLKERMSRLKKAMEDAGKALIMVAPLLASAQILISIIGLTGVGIKFSEMVISASHSSVPLALILGMVVCMILGMGISSAAAYLLSAAVVGSALISLGIEELPAHMFLFYFSVFGTITPPVCIAVYVASGIAKSNWLETAWIAIRLGLSAFIVPYMFIYNPLLLMEGSAIRIIWAFISAGIGVLALSGGTMGFFVKKISFWERIILLIAALLLISPELYSDFIGLILVGFIYLYERMCIGKLK